MTMIVGWLSCDSRGPASAYITSDSRYSWGPSTTYDYGRKVFALTKFPDILGYCGDVVFSMAAISQVVTLAENGLLFDTTADSLQRSNSIYGQMQLQFVGYPSNLPIIIYHISRDLNHGFWHYCYSWDSKKGWSRSVIPLNEPRSSVVFSNGSGKTEFDNLMVKYDQGDISGTSRNIFQCFCQALASTVDHTCGGAPQLVGLYRSKFNGIDYGIISSGKRYCHGAPLGDIIESNQMRWYNTNFEICDCKTLRIREDAMRQPNPNLHLATP